MTSRGYDVVTPRAVAPLIVQLQGQRAGYAATYAQLERDPCDTTLAAYRLSGPLEPAVCGLHMRDGWRLAFTMQPAEHEDALPSVVVLFVDKREPRHGTSDIWEVLHDLFGVENPPAGHHKPPCCEDAVPELPQDELDAFLRQLAQLTRGRR